MKTRDQIYSKEAAELLRDITTYHYIQHNQLLKLYPGKENKIDNLLSYLVRQGRIFYEPERDMYHDGMEAFPDMHIISALWVLIEFIEKVDYHSLSDFPITLIFIADGELYEVIYVASENEALLEHALTQINHDAEKRIVIVESTDQIAKLSIDTFYTTEDGMLITPQKLPYGKGYSLVEVTAPYGYVLDSTPIFFNVAADTATGDGAITVVKVKRPNMPQKGIIKITKTGEVFQSVIEQSGVYQPVYEIGKISGAVFEIRAAEDIYTLDGVMHYAKGELVDTVTSGSDGIAVSHQLYLGKYEIREITAPYSMVLNNTIQTVELTYAGQEISVTEVSGSLYNERQRIKVSLDKALEQNELFGIGMNGEIANISFGLYAAEDIIAADGTKLPANGLIEIISFDADGHAVCQTDLPLGKYYLQERSTDSHYLLSDAKFPFEFAYAGQDVEVVEITANNGEAIKNNLKYGSVSGLKVDEDGKTIAGAKFGLFHNDETEYTEENALMTAVSDENGIFRFDNIPVGTWVVRELIPAEGFVLNEQAYQVTITEDGQIIDIKLENRYIRSDILGHKVDEDGKVISGALFGLFKEGTEEFTEDTTFMTAESDENGIFRFEQIRYGKWIVKELRPAEGFVPNEKLYKVTVSEDGAIIEFTVENKYIRGNIAGLKVDEDGKTIEGAVFGLFRENEKEFTEQNAVMTAASGFDGKFLFENVRYGKWVVRELSCPEKYVLSDEIFEVTITEKNETITITAVNKHVTGKVQAVKISSKDHDKLLSGAEFEIGIKRVDNGTNQYGVATFKKVADFSQEQIPQIKQYAEDFRTQIKELQKQREIEMKERMEADGIPDAQPRYTVSETGEHFIVSGTETVNGDSDELPL